MKPDPIYHRLGPETAHWLPGSDIFDNPVDPTQLAEFVDDPGHELVFATRADQVIGFASGTTLRHPDKHPVFFINEIDVTPENQRQGIGTALTRMLMHIAKERGCLGIWLATEQGNDPARGLYRALDGTETQHVVVYDWDMPLPD